MKKMITAFALLSFVVLATSCTDTFEEDFTELSSGNNNNSNELADGRTNPSDPE